MEIEEHRLGSTAQLIAIALLIFLATSAFQVIKHLVHPDISMLESHIVTSLFVALIGTMTAWFVSRGYRKLYGQIRKETTNRKLMADALRESEERYRGVVDNIGIGIALVSPGMEILALNARMRSWYPEIDVTNRPICYRSFNDPPREGICSYCPTCKTLQDGMVHESVTETPSDGGIRYYRVISSPIRDKDGGIACAVEMVEDITERKRAEEERTRLVTAIEQVAEGIMICDANWIIQYANPAFERITGYARSDLIGKHTRILKTDAHDKAFYRNIRSTLERGEAWSGRVPAKRKDGTLYEVEALSSPVRDESGNIINYISIRRDVTHEMKLERELRQSQKMESIGTLAGGIAHDFNNILTATIGYTEMALAKIPEDSSLRRNLGQVLQSGFRAKDLVRQILTFSHQSDQERKPVQIAPIVQEALRLLRSSLPSTVQIDQDIAINPENGVVLADPTQIHQVLMNLENSRKVC